MMLLVVEQEHFRCAREFLSAEYIEVKTSKKCEIMVWYSGETLRKDKRARYF